MLGLRAVESDEQGVLDGVVENLSAKDGGGDECEGADDGRSDSKAIGLGISNGMISALGFNPDFKSSMSQRVT